MNETQACNGYVLVRAAAPQQVGAIILPGAGQSGEGVVMREDAVGDYKRGTTVFFDPKDKLTMTIDGDKMIAVHKTDIIAARAPS